VNNDDLNLIRNKRSELILKKEQLEKTKKRIFELEQDPLMKEYYSLKKFVEDNNEERLQKQTEKDIDKILIYTKNSNKILYNYGEVLVRTYEDYYTDDFEDSPMHVYRDLETKEYYFVMIDELELMPLEWRVGYSLLDNEYEKLRKYFVEQIQFRTQEDVINEMLIQEKRLIKGK